MRRRWRGVIAVTLLLAFLAGQVEIAHHECEHGDDETHCPGSCAVCAFLQHTALPTGTELPLIMMAATSRIVAPELPTPPPSPLHFSFRPRSPPRFAPL